MSTLELYVFYCAIALAAGSFGYVLWQKFKKWKTEILTVKVAAAITDYFLQGHVKVAAQCVPQPQEKHFLAFLDSEPHKRFRYSHIVETVLIKHIEKTVGVRIDRVYWRFPLPEHQHAGTPLVAAETVAPSLAAAPGAESSGRNDGQTGATKNIKAQEDEYVTLGLLRAKVRHDYLVNEGSWEVFEKAMLDGELEAQAEAAEVREKSLDTDAKSPESG